MTNKKSEKNIDNLLFSGDDEIDNFANDFKIKNIDHCRKSSFFIIRTPTASFFFCCLQPTQKQQHRKLSEQTE